MKNFDIMKGSLKNQIFEGGFPKNQYLGRNYLKGGGGGGGGGAGVGGEW